MTKSPMEIIRDRIPNVGPEETTADGVTRLVRERAQAEARESLLLADRKRFIAIIRTSLDLSYKLGSRDHDIDENGHEQDDCRECCRQQLIACLRDLDLSGPQLPVGRLSVHVNAIRPPDPKWEAMKRVWDACTAANVETPDAVIQFFNYELPCENGVSIDLEGTDCFSKEENGLKIRIDLAQLPKDVKYLDVIQAQAKR